MSRNHKHIKDHNSQKDLTTDLFSRTEIQWEKSKEEVWKDISAKFQEEGQSREMVRHFLPGKQWLALAASVALLLAVSGFLRFYSITTRTTGGEHTSIQLPDGSLVEMNAQSTLIYHPYWWRVARTLKLEGEAWFEVETGNRFKVQSTSATTEVLGTTFNVFAREMNYRVTCHTGMVKVSSRITNSNAILTPNNEAFLNDYGIFEVTAFEDQGGSPGWKDNLLMFKSTPLRLVFDEIERQYGIIIVTSNDLNQLYSGNFALDTSVENILTLLCRPFDLTYEHSSGKTYRILPLP